jgi:hypothetical protein
MLASRRSLDHVICARQQSARLAGNALNAFSWPAGFLASSDWSFNPRVAAAFSIPLKRKVPIELAGFQMTDPRGAWNHFSHEVQPLCREVGVDRGRNTRNVPAGPREARHQS